MLSRTKIRSSMGPGHASIGDTTYKAIKTKTRTFVNRFIASLLSTDLPASADPNSLKAFLIKLR